MILSVGLPAPLAHSQVAVLFHSPQFEQSQAWALVLSGPPQRSSLYSWPYPGSIVALGSGHRARFRQGRKMQQLPG
ncbi:hypothetical protein BJX99DRAFT_235386 [Aspergillus californicus]